MATVQDVSLSHNMTAIEITDESTRNLDSESDKIHTVYDYSKLSTMPSNYVPDLDNIITSGKSICYDFASVFAAMLRSQGMPVKLIKGYTTNVKGYLAWNEIYDSEAGEWNTLDTTYDAEQKAADYACSVINNTAHYSKVFEY